MITRKHLCIHFYGSFICWLMLIVHVLYIQSVSRSIILSVIRAIYNCCWNPDGSYDYCDTFCSLLSDCCSPFTIGLNMANQEKGSRSSVVLKSPFFWLFKNFSVSVCLSRNLTDILSLSLSLSLCLSHSLCLTLCLTTSDSVSLSLCLALCLTTSDSISLSQRLFRIHKIIHCDAIRCAPRSFIHSCRLASVQSIVRSFTP